MSDHGLNGTLRNHFVSCTPCVMRHNVSVIAAPASLLHPSKSYGSEHAPISRMQRFTFNQATNWSEEWRRKFSSRQMPFSENSERYHQQETLTSPGSERRRCWREPASLTNLFLGPTRSAKLPMVTLQRPDALRWLTMSSSQLSVFFRFTYATLSCFLHPCDADTLARTTHSWHSFKSGLDWFRFERALK